MQTQYLVLGFLLIWNIIEAITIGLLKYEIFPKSDKVDYFTQLLPLESMSNLIVNPSSRLSIIKEAGSKLGVGTDVDYSVHFSTVLIVLAWTFIFVFASFKLLEKRDL